MIVHVCHFTFTRAELLHHDSDEFLGNVDSEMLHRFHQLAVDALGDDLRLANHQFVAFAAHHLDQNGELQLSPAQHFERIRRPGVFHSQGDVCQ